MSEGTVLTVNLKGGGNWRTSGLWYGYERDITSSSKLVTRIGNLALHVSNPIQSKIARYVENLDGSVNYWLHPNNALLRWDNSAPAKLDGTEGNLQLHKPGYYYRVEVEGNKVRHMFSETALPGFTWMPPKPTSWVWGTYDNISNVAAAVCSLTFDTNGDPARDGAGFPIFAANAARYRGGSNNPALDALNTSMLGMARTSVAKADIRAKCAAIGAHHGNYRVLAEIARLYVLEYANYDVQEAYNPVLTAEGYRQGGLGQGSSVISSEWNTHNAYNPYIPNGVTAKLGNNTGIVNYTIKGWAGGADKVVQSSSYRGLENWYQYLYLIVDDLMIYHQTLAEGDKSKAYICENPSLFANPANDSLPGAPTGYIERAQLPRTTGYILLESDNLFGDVLPKTIGGSGNQGTCDYYWIPATFGWHMALLFAAGHRSAYSGPRALDTYGRSTTANASSGFRLGR